MAATRGREHVGRIPAAAEPDFEHAEFGRVRGKQQEGGGGDHLEHRDGGAGVHALDRLQRFGQLGIVDQRCRPRRMRSWKRTRCGEV